MTPLEKMMRKLREKERDGNSFYWQQDRVMYEQLDHEEYLRNKAEDAYLRWLRDNNPDSIKYKYPNNPNDHEKFMWIEGYLANRRGTYR
jgi:hypothetical protein